MSIRMQKIELRVLKRDIDAVLECLGRGAYMQIDAPAPGGVDAALPEDEVAIRDSLYAAAEFLGLGPGAAAPAGLPGPEEKGFAAECCAEAGRLRSGMVEAETRLEASSQALAELRAFGKLGLPLSEIDILSFIHLQFGSIAPERLAALRAEAGDRAVIIALDEEGRIAAISSKKGRFALDSALHQAGFKETAKPGAEADLPGGLLEGLEAEESRLKEALAGLEAERAAYAASRGERLRILIRSFDMALAVSALKGRLASTEQVYLIRGWVPRSALREMEKNLERATQGRLALRSFDPQELASVSSGAEDVPVKAAHGRFVSSFERLVFSYGVPRYGSIDPTPFVALWFVLLFSIMFGDLGQGLVILLAGIVLLAVKKGGLLKFRPYAPILAAIGIGSSVMGILEGSIFCNEQLLVPATRFITGNLLGVPMDRVISLIPTDGIGRIVAFFIFSIALGALVNSVGLVLNLVNLARAKRWGEFAFSKTGLAGTILFWYALSLAIRAGFKSRLGMWDFLPLALPAAALFFAHPLRRLLDRQRPAFHEGGFTFAVGGFVEVLESLSYYVSGTVSFLRVGAFSLSHAILSFIVFTMAEMVRRSVPGAGALLQGLVFVIGNAIIIALEGMIVAIQVTRLQYYEFFSKFFTETGTEWKPFSFADLSASNLANANNLANAGLPAKGD